MRRVRYSVVASLDGFIAGARNEIDWILPDPDRDFQAVYGAFDTALMGRRTFEFAQQGPGARLPGMETIVCSRTLSGEAAKGFTVTADAAGLVSRIKTQPGRDIWLFGGGDLFASLLLAGLIDSVEIGLMPILLGEGVPLFGGRHRSPRLTLERVEPKANGIIWLTYSPGARA